MIGFVAIQEEASKIYEKYGALGYGTSEVTHTLGMNGCTGLADILEIREDEQVFMSESHFWSRSEHDQVVMLLEHDVQMSKLIKKMSLLIDFSQVVRWEIEGR